MSNLLLSGIEDIRVRAELTKLLYKQSVPIQLLGILTAVISTWLFWDVTSQHLIITWLVLICSIYILRLIVSFRFNQTSMDEYSTIKWSYIYIVGAFITGVLWSGLALQYEPSWHASYLIMLFIIYTGITASAFNTHSSVFIAFPAFYLPPVSVLMYVTVSHSETYGGQLLFLFIIYIVMMFISAFKYHKHIVALFEMRFKNERLTGELRQANKELEKLADVDGLTGIFNRRSMDKFLVNEWNRHYRFQRPLSLLIIDLDYFKQYNDTYGHDAGDKCLISVASLLKNHTARAADMAARFGGEEFVVILTESDQVNALKMAEKIQASLNEMQIPNEGSPKYQHVTMSIGLATCIPKQGNSSNQMVLAADNALYQAKKEGRNRIVQSQYPD